MQTDPQFKIRIPQEMLDVLAEAAQLNDRSITAEIRYRLAMSIVTLPKKRMTIREFIGGLGARES